MVKFNELYITPDNSKIVIDVAIEDLCWYEAVFISEVLVSPSSSFSPSLPFSSSPSPHIFSYKASELPDLSLSSVCSAYHGVLPSEEDLASEMANGRKRIRIEVSKKDLGYDIAGNLFYIYVIAKGVPHPDTPCGMDEEVTMGVVYNLKDIKDSAIGYIKGSLKEEPTQDRKSFIDFILRYKSFTLFLDTGNYTEANKLWDKISNKTLSVSSYKSKGCCNG